VTLAVDLQFASIQHCAAPGFSRLCFESVSTPPRGGSMGEGGFIKVWFHCDGPMIIAPFGNP
jgi:hypothetical protein